MKCTISLLMVLGMTLSSIAADLTPQEIIEKSYKTIQLSGSEAVSTLIIKDDKGRERVRKTAQVTKLYDNGDTEKRLVRFLEPADVKGTGLLTVDYEDKDDDLWLYMPALRKTRRIVSSEKAKSFMGSEFSYADMMPPAVEDFTYNQLDDETIDNELCHVIEMIPVNDDIMDENGFSKRVLYISKKDYAIRKSVYYDFDGELWKTLNVLDVKLVDPANGKYRPMHMVMENEQNGRQSIMKVEQLEVKPNVKDEYFTTRYLERP